MSHQGYLKREAVRDQTNGTTAVIKNRLMSGTKRKPIQTLFWLVKAVPDDVRIMPLHE